MGLQHVGSRPQPVEPRQVWMPVSGSLQPAQVSNVSRVEPAAGVANFKVFCQPFVQPQWQVWNSGVQVAMRHFVPQVFSHSVAPVGKHFELALRFDKHGPAMGKSVVDAIHAFGAQGKLFHIHFRNVSAPLPHFVETFVDEGYMDMYQVIKALRQVSYRGGVAPEHTPAMVGQHRTGIAFTYGYVKALVQRANEEVGGG